MSRTASQNLTLAGPAGAIEAVAEWPEAAEQPAAFMVVCHPHPLHGGTMQNKVVTTLARAAHATGAASLRFNFRGVGGSAGTHDDGRGEVDDALAAIAAGCQRWPHASLWLAGFSFGGVVALRASVRTEAGKVARLVTVAPALGKAFTNPDDIALPDCPWLIVQGDSDEIIDGALVIDWARRIEPAARLALLAGAGHFFHGRLPELQQHIEPFLRG